MSKRKKVKVTLDVYIDDPKQLMRAALVAALASGMTAHEWRHMRYYSGLPGYAHDVQWLLDTTPADAGFQIENSDAMVCSTETYEVWDDHG